MALEVAMRSTVEVPAHRTYRLQELSVRTAIDIMRRHPLVMVGGILQRNPFFVPPEQFLARLSGVSGQTNPQQTNCVT
jgi:hypothetical protein